MELEVIKTLLVRFLEGSPLTDEEGEQLLAGLEELIDEDRLDLLEGVRYHAGEEKVLTEEDMRHVYWEVEMRYAFHEDDHHHDTFDGEKPGFIHKWGWLYVLLTGLVAALAYMLIRRYGLW